MLGLAARGELPDRPGRACALTIVFTVAAATTLLPALFGVFGRRVLSRRQRRRLAGHGTAPGPTGRGAWAGAVDRRPAGLGLVALAIIAILAVPSLSVLSAPPTRATTRRRTTRQAYDLLAEGLVPGSTARCCWSCAPARRRAARSGCWRPAAPETTCRTSPVAAAPGTSAFRCPRHVTRVEGDIRPDRHLEDTSSRPPRTAPPCGRTSGVTAIFADFATALPARFRCSSSSSRLAVLLLLFAFRSLLIPPTAAVMNLLAAAAPSAS